MKLGTYVILSISTMVAFSVGYAIVTTIVHKEPADKVQAVLFLGVPLVLVAGGVVGVMSGFLDFKSGQERWDETAITQADFDSVQFGVTRSSIVDRFGPGWGPAHPSNFTVAPPVHMDCLHYNRLGKGWASAGDPDSMFRFCFGPETDTLQIKALVGRNQSGGY